MGMLASNRKETPAMAQYDVTHTCGHLVTHHLFGKHEARYKRVDWLKTVVCSDCYKKQVQDQNAEKCQQAREVNAMAGLPALVGSPKQVAWAETIRADKLAEMEWIVNKGVKPEHRETLQFALDNIRQRTNASWWIDHGCNVLKLFHLAKCFWHFTELSPEYLGVRDDRGKFPVELI